MQEPTTSLLNNQASSQQSKPKPKPKKQTKKKGVNRELLNLMTEIRNEYYLFIEAYPEYEFPLPSLKDEKDILALHEQLEHAKKIQRFEYAVRDLPITYFYGVKSVTGIGRNYAEQTNNQQLYDKWGRFEQILQQSFEELNPMLVETLKLYPFLQRQKPHVLFRLAYSLKILWDAAEDTGERVDIPEDF